ncbi:arf-GAP with dual PH domain-containing protein 2 isoform X3 [Rhinatrema bivittatum]|uniref:arf-GAP with dual PH domain-containing protein 2 isoform X3 n=1 Tax=Rhinatrema bivittatum TaxID=194408 RepID=UPI00112DCB10|nr:arf-GAP with dual PH domain-containing protein 2 isoform X3 [Rhinatrema bivittatum]XP_029456579.1 arf-GAP with dual PH domain-containing protein 2 isoform X3 [Rhinatrema bivittatum]
MADRDGNRRALLQLLALPGNARCADCGAPDPDWASYKLGIFVCLNCSGIHRNFPEISKIKSTRLDFWDDDLVQHMRAHGNLRAKAKYEAAVPPHYYRPQPTDCLVLKEQWIRAKYEREEFTTDRTGPGTVSAGSKEGFLWKRGKDKAQFLLRRFVLSEKEGVLRYYTKDEIKGPKAIMPLKDLNAMFQAEKIGNPNGLQLTYVKGIQTRNVFVYHESGKEIVDWFTAIRAARLHYLKTEFPTTTESELIPRITRKYLKEGYMEKTGPTASVTSPVFSLGSKGRHLRSDGLPWIYWRGSYFITKIPWMRTSRVLSLLEAETTGTRSRRACLEESGGRNGKMGSPLPPQDGSFCLPAKMRRIKKPGWRL